MAKERKQNPVIGDQIKLRVFLYNSNNRTNAHEVQKVEIYFLDPNGKTAENTDGRRLVQTIETNDITLEDTGHYSVTITLEEDCYTIGHYRDIWTLETREDDPLTTLENAWRIYPDLWYANTEPTVYDFNFSMRPNRLRVGTKQYITVDVVPNVPRATDLERYYTNLAIASPLKISIEQACVDCMPQEKDLRLIVDGSDVEFRENCVGYYFLDTTDYDCGIYNVWFEMELGESTYKSANQQLQIFE